MSFGNCTVRAPERQPSLPAPSEESFLPPAGRPSRLSIDDTAARAGSALTAVCAHTRELDASTLRVFLAVLRQLVPWRRHGEAVDVWQLAAAADVSTRRVYSALAALTGIGALTWTATGARSGIVGLPAPGAQPAPGAVWEPWAATSDAAVRLIDGVLARQELDDNQQAPDGWVVKRAAEGTREASAPVAALRLAVAVLAATWPSQSPTAATAGVPTAAIGAPRPVKLAWRWLRTHAGVAYTPRPGRGVRGVGLPGYTDEIPAPAPRPMGTTPSLPMGTTPSPIPIPRSNQVEPRPPLPPAAPPARSTHQPDEGQGGEDPGENTHEPQAAAPPGGVVCRRPPDEAAFELALIALAAVACPPPATRQATASLMRKCAEPAEVLAAAGWTSADVTDWLAADLRANPVKQVRDAAALAGHLLGKAAAAAAVGARRPSAARAARDERAAAQQAEAEEVRRQIAEREARVEALVADASPHLAAMSAEQRFALRSRDKLRRWALSDFADFDALPDGLLRDLAVRWHDQVCADDCAAAGWDAVADFVAAAGGEDMAWVAEKIRANQGPPNIYGQRVLYDAWCAAHHTHPRETGR